MPTEQPEIEEGQVWESNRGTGALRIIIEKAHDDFWLVRNRDRPTRTGYLTRVREKVIVRGWHFIGFTCDAD